MFWDIETSPNIGFFWRPSWKASIPVENIIHERAIICICWKWQGQKKVNHLKWDNGNDEKMVREFYEEIERADEMVAHNGDKFDMAWYNGRHLIHGLEPIPKQKTVDTYKMAARNFNLNSYKLDYLANILLGRSKTPTGFDLWRKIVLDNNKSAMKKMVRYCKNDVELLEEVWEKLWSYDGPSTHAAVNATGDVKTRWMCGYCGSDYVMRSKVRVTAKGMKQHQMKCLECGRYYTISNLVHNWFIESKAG